MDSHSQYLLAHGRTLLANGRAGEAIEPLRRHHATWSTPQPASPYTAEALYWLGRASLAAGEARGARMLAEAKAALARSPVPAHRRLAADSN